MRTNPSLCRNAIILLAAFVLALVLSTGSAVGEPRRRSAGAAAPPAGEGARVEQAVEAAQNAGVERRDLRALTEACERGGFSESQTVRILSLAAQLALEELPVRSFAAKVGEGVSKRAGPDRIVEVAERRALSLNRARSIINGLVLDGFAIEGRDEILPDVAEALEAGMSGETIRDILAASLEDGGVAEIRRKLFP
ncbi:MAG TPA: hypothetical protein VN317_10680 [Candidatus Methanoperedens sp.]|nr:hypothetical protein [Candidatus Methanoperedens sp.]